MAKSSHVPHIKRHTAGTSNELSFDVLDAKRDKLDAQQKRKGKKSFMLDFRRKPGDGGVGAIPAGKSSPAAAVARGAHASISSVVPAEKKRWRSKSAPAAKGPSLVSSGNPLIPVDEVLRRKKSRRRRTMRNYAILAVAIIAAIGVAGWFAYSGYQAKQDFGGQYRELVSQVSIVDASLVEIDDMMDDPLGATTDEQRSVARKKAVGITSTSDHVQAEAESLRSIAPAEQDCMALDQLVEGAKGRVSLVGLAMEAFDVADDASGVRQAAEAAWDTIVSVDVNARDAIAASNGAATTSALGEATDTLRVSRDEFAAAREQLLGLEAQVSALDLSQQTTYIDKRIESLEYALATNEALAAGDRHKAAEQNDLYEEADKESAALAEKLPQSIGDVTDAAFSDDILKIQGRYDNQRKRIVEADSLVRKYLKD